MASQIRKFEQEAIVENILNAVDNHKDASIKHLESLQAFKDIQTQTLMLAEMGTEIESLRNQADELKKKIRILIKNFNSKHSNSCYEAKFDSYGYNTKDSLTIDFDTSRYHGARYLITNKLAVALLPSDAKENLSNIIEEISQSFNITNR